MSPSVRANIVANYRRLYRETFGQETICSDDDIFAAYSACACAPTAQDRDEWTLDDMRAPARLAAELGVSL